jgi:hypothetical protein
MRLLLADKVRAAGVLIGLGILTKIFPGALLLVVPAALGFRGARRLALAVGATLLGVLVPLGLIRFDLLWATAVSLMTRPAWETLPAVLSGNYLYGVVAPLTERFTAETARSAAGPYSSVALALQLVTALIAVAATLLRSRRGNVLPADLYGLVAMAVCALLLGSKGFSPQYLVWLLPLVLLVWPNRIGMTYVLAFTVYGYLYYWCWYPDMIGYYQLGTVSLEQVAHSIWLSVVTRTLLLLVVGSHLVIRAIRPAVVGLVRPASPRESFRALTSSTVWST